MSLPPARKSRRMYLSFSPPYASSDSQSGEMEVRPPRKPKLAWQAWPPEKEEKEKEKKITNPRE